MPDTLFDVRKLGDTCFINGILAGPRFVPPVEFDCIFSSDTFELFKPDPGMYLGAADWLDLRPEEVMMVAAHKADLRAAAQCGLKTAFVKRPHEYGRNSNPDLASEAEFTLNSESFLDLADQFGC